MRTLTRLLIGMLAVVGCIAMTTGLWFASGGISARRAPGHIETVSARRLRSLAIPPSARAVVNPVTATPEALREGMEHFADHCAACHGNDGGGNTEMGRGLYPRAPDMRQPATQALSDGELFYIIENGVRLTGMPAWGEGTEESQTASWRLVHFIRHLPALTDAEVEAMKALNPKTPDEWREEDEARHFLEGSAEAPKPAPAHTHGGRK